jgi:hypothetical protein
MSKTCQREKGSGTLEGHIFDILHHSKKKKEKSTDAETVTGHIYLLMFKRFNTVHFNNVIRQRLPSINASTTEGEQSAVNIAPSLMNSEVMFSGIRFIP